MQSSAVEAIQKQSSINSHRKSAAANDAILSGIKSTTNYGNSGLCGKMASDSAFHSIGDGLELEQEEKCNVTHGLKHPARAEPTKLELQMKLIAEEAKKRRIAKGMYLL